MATGAAATIAAERSDEKDGRRKEEGRKALVPICRCLTLPVVTSIKDVRIEMEGRGLAKKKTLNLVQTWPRGSKIPKIQRTSSMDGPLSLVYSVRPRTESEACTVPTQGSFIHHNLVVFHHLLVLTLTICS